MLRLAVPLCALVAASLAVPGAQAPAPERLAVHVLNRTAFGPRPGDVEKIVSLGIDAYIEQQLSPERIPDGAAADRLAGFETLDLSEREIWERYERPLLEARRQRRQQATDGTDPERRPMQSVQQAAIVSAEMAQQKLIRAIYSERQLQEVLTDFWFNHFNVDARKGRVRFLLTEYEREAIRPHVLGRFRDLLGATAKSPAMLFYLDNWMSSAPAAPALGAALPRPGRGRRPLPTQVPARQARGLNENYARELLELHTLGVDGGYTQKDVTEVARVFTGWTIGGRPGGGGGGFHFEPRLHDTGDKVVLGQQIRSAGSGEGERVLDMLAAHPATARHVAGKLARRFVGDVPPPPLVDRTAAKFLETDGDLREVTRTILTSPEFLSPSAFQAKTKTPFEFVVSAVRVTDVLVRDARALVRTLQELGMPLYQCQPPTGYKDTADAWTNTGALVGRMNFAVAIASGRLPGVTAAGERRDPETILGVPLSDTTRTIVARANTPSQALALALGSPEFQKR